MDFSDLFSESHPEQWKTSLYNCLKSVLQMKRYNMWLLKLLFKEEVRVNMENYIYFLQQSPSSSLLKFVEKHLVDDNDNTISVEEMKLRVKESVNKESVKNKDTTDLNDNSNLKQSLETNTNVKSNTSSPKISFNLKWKSGSFECNLMNAHTKLIEENLETAKKINQPFW
jgi:hypothetical protein